MSDKASSDTQLEIKERYQAFIRNSSEGIWRFELKKPIPLSLPTEKKIELCFKDGYLAEANDAMARMYGFTSAKDITGIPLSEFMIQSDPQNIAYLTAFFENGYKLTGVESHEKDNEGNPKIFRNSLVGVVENNHILRAWGTQQDVTEQRTALHNLERSEQRLTLALQASAVGLWEWDVEKNELYWSDELKVLFGLKRTDSITYEKYLTLLHPDDRPSTQKIIQESMKTGDPYHVEHRVVWPDGSIHWFLGKGRAILKNGKVIRMIGTTTNIDDSKHASALAEAYSQLKSQRAQLIELNKTKDEFIALASHQLRTPATAVKQYIGLLLDEIPGPLTADQTQYLQIAFDSNERQLRIINDLLKTAQIDSDRYSLAKQEENIATIIRDCAIDLKDMFEMRRQTLELQDIIDIKLDMDANEMKLVIMNLLENASKYSYPGTTIKILMKRTPKRIEIDVVDTGVGIDEADSKRIFDKFTRINNELSDTVIGTGFGLYWVKRIVTLHGGTIRVKSSPGKGSTFMIRLPI